MTPLWEYYGDDDTSEGSPDDPIEELEPTPETGDVYVGVDIQLPRDEQVRKGKVVSRKGR